MYQWLMCTVLRARASMPRVLKVDRIRVESAPASRKAPNMGCTKVTVSAVPFPDARSNPASWKRR